jgi:hypothetical protein
LLPSVVQDQRAWRNEDFFRYLGHYKSISKLKVFLKESGQFDGEDFYSALGPHEHGFLSQLSNGIRAALPRLESLEILPTYNPWHVQYWDPITSLTGFSTLRYLRLPQKALLGEGCV